ncbi:MAG: hypothetical protein WD231_03250 [Candidatus Woykebacteria bacterium]
MSISILITGGSQKDRYNKALEEANLTSSKEDTIVFDSKEEGGIAPLKSFLSNLSKKPYNSLYLAAIILEAENLTQEAQNSLLKTLEEPPSTTRLILTAHSEGSLKPTIVSRLLRQEVGQKISYDIKLPEEILKSAPSARLDLCEKLDMLEWIYYLRSLLKELINSGTSTKIIPALVKYIRFVEKISKEPIANPKLARYLIVSFIPKELATSLPILQDSATI